LNRILEFFKKFNKKNLIKDNNLLELSEITLVLLFILKKLGFKESNLIINYKTDSTSIITLKSLGLNLMLTINNNELNFIFDKRSSESKRIYKNFKKELIKNKINFEKINFIYKTQ
jgi:hypothetical protein